jgi:hypothetical protein
MKRYLHVNRRRRGVAIIYAVFGAFVAASMVAVMLTAASVTHTESELKADKLQASYLAEGAVEAAKRELRSAIANWKVPPTDGQVDIDGQPVSYSITSPCAQEPASQQSSICRTPWPGAYARHRISSWRCS